MPKGNEEAGEVRGIWMRHEEWGKLASDAESQGQTLNAQARQAIRDWVAPEP